MKANFEATACLRLEFTGGRLRVVAATLWLSLLAWTAGSWFGICGVGLVLVASTRWYRCLLAGQTWEIIVSATQLEAIWVAPLAVCMRAGWQRQWICRDELTPAAWAELLRWMYRHVPTQAVGFNISR